LTEGDDAGLPFEQPFQGHAARMSGDVDVSWRFRRGRQRDRRERSERRSGAVLAPVALIMRISIAF